MERAKLPLDFTWEAYSKLGWNIMYPLWVGGILAGIILGALAYFLTLRMVPVVKAWRIPRWPRRHWRQK